MAEVSDPYLDPETGLLRNLVNAGSKAELDAIEGALVFARALQLIHRPVPATGDLDEFRAIHRRLFQDIYAWAGQLRTVDLRKNVEGADFFLPVSVIDRASQYAAEELRQDRMLAGLGRVQFIEKLSYRYDQWNYIHPFREGNGRTQRLFWNRIAADAGWQLDWRSVHGDVNDAACRVASERRDFGPLQSMFDQIVSPVSDASASTQVARLTFRPGSELSTERPSKSPHPGLSGSDYEPGQTDDPGIGLGR